MSSNPHISIVSPVYLAEKIVDELVKRIAESVSKITPDFEIILVEDGSPDNSWAKIEESCKAYNYVKGVKLSRNYGQHYAITAGIQEAKGDYVIVMDCDLQDDPKYIADLYNKAKEGFDVVYTIKTSREHGRSKNISAYFFYLLFNWLTDNKSVTAKGTIGAYSILSRKTVDAFNLIKDTHRNYLMVLRVIGFKSGYIEVEHQKRFEGKSSYDFSKLVTHALNGIAAESDKLLRISITIGFTIFVISFLGAIGLIIFYLVNGALPGYTSLMVMLLFSTGLIMMSIGITGMYIGKIFDQVKGRPLYLIDEKLNF
ncbi:MAG: hypothetical protein JWO06_2706 [Bacteroidota bacterium]|nr:hypothetical protein [Bacteroidota bacterium]